MIRHPVEPDIKKGSVSEDKNTAVTNTGGAKISAYFSVTILDTGVRADIDSTVS